MSWELDYRGTVIRCWRIRRGTVPFDRNTHTSWLSQLPTLAGIEWHILFLHVWLREPNVRTALTTIGPAKKVPKVYTSMNSECSKERRTPAIARMPLRSGFLYLDHSLRESNTARSKHLRCEPNDLPIASLGKRFFENAAYKRSPDLLAHAPHLHVFESHKVVRDAHILLNGPVGSRIVIEQICL